MALKNLEFVTVKFDYDPSDSHELAIHKGERLTLIDDSQHWWKVMNATGQTGYVPSNFVKRSKQGIFSSLRNTLGRRKSRHDSLSGARRSNPSSPTPNSNMSMVNLNNSQTRNKNVGSTESIDSKSSPMNNPDDSSSIRQNFAEMRLHDGYPTEQPSLMQTNMSYSHNHQDNAFISPNRSHNWAPRPPMPQPYPQVFNGDHVMMSNENGHAKWSSTNSQFLPNNNNNNNFVHSSATLDLSVHSNNTAASTNTLNHGNGDICMARFNYEASQSDELSIQRGDKIKILEKSSDDWWRGMLFNEDKLPRVGWFPSNYVTLDLSKPLNRSGSTSQPSIPNVNNLNRDEFRPHPIRETVLTLYPFTRNQVEELSFSANELLDVLEKPIDDPEWWKCRNSQGEVGLVPRIYVRVVASPAPHTADSQSVNFGSLSNKKNELSTNMSPMKQCTDGEFLRLRYISRSVSAHLYGDRPWFWGVVSRSECESLLNQFSSTDEFIVRDSESHPGDLTITINAGNKTRNFKVHIENDQFHIGQKVFNRIDDLIEHYRTHPIFKNEEEKHYLLRPFVYPNSNEVQNYASTNHHHHHQSGNNSSSSNNASELQQSYNQLLSTSHGRY